MDLQGLEKNDFILEFGHLDGDNSLADVGQLVAVSEGVSHFSSMFSFADVATLSSDRAADSRPPGDSGDTAEPDTSTRMGRPGNAWVGILST